MRASIRGLTFHDLRGTAVVTLARAGCNEVEIYSITGHKPSDVRAILTAHYLPRDAEVARNAMWTGIMLVMSEPGAHPGKSAEEQAEYQRHSRNCDRGSLGPRYPCPITSHRARYRSRLMNS